MVIMSFENQYRGEIGSSELKCIVIQQTYDKEGAIRRLKSLNVFRFK